MELKPTIIFDNQQKGFHNTDLESSASRVIKGNTYKDLSTICIIPTRGVIHARVVQNWLSLITPMNQKFVRLIVWGMEVGEAYNTTIKNVLDHPELREFKYILSLEEDNMPPPDGLLKLYESIENYDVVGGLYWTKGEGGQAQIYGNPKEFPKNFIPQPPKPGELQECNGLGMGFNLFKLEMFKTIEQPWFKTVQEYSPGQGTRLMTQDLYFYEKAAKSGFRFASDNRVLVGHYDQSRDIVW